MKKLFFFVLILFFLPFKIFSAGFSDVLINEIAWMGNLNSANDEWLELKNNTLDSLDLEGWKLSSRDGKLNIFLTGKIPGMGFFVLERSDDNSVLGRKADQIYTGALANGGMDLFLHDNLGNLIDQINCGGGWFAGDNTTKQTMERLSAGGNKKEDWQTSQNPGGTPSTLNNLNIEEKPNILENVNSHTEAYSNSVFLNEIFPSPGGEDGLYEWIELFNEGDQEVDLSGWQIKDASGSVVTFTIPQKTIISAKGYFLFGRPETKIILNNEGDELALLWPNGTSVVKISYGKAPIGSSYSKTSGDWQWSTTPTPGKENFVTFKTAKKSSLKKNANSVKNIVPAAADISQTLNSSSLKLPRPWFLLIFALISALFFSALALVIKTKFFSKKK